MIYENICLFKLEKQRYYAFYNEKEFIDFFNSVLNDINDFEISQTYGKKYFNGAKRRNKYIDADDINNYYNDKIIEIKRKKEKQQWFQFTNTYLLVLLDNNYEKDFYEIYQKLKNNITS